MRNQGKRWKKCLPLTIPIFSWKPQKRQMNRKQKKGKNVYLLNCLLLKSRDRIISKSSVVENEQRFPLLQRFSLLQRFYISSVYTIIEQNRIQEIVKKKKKRERNQGKMGKKCLPLTIPFFSLETLETAIEQENKKGGKCLPSESFVVEEQRRDGF